MNILYFKNWPNELKNILDLSFKDTNMQSIVDCFDLPILSNKNLFKEYKFEGFHCTRLTKKEIDRILEFGMSLQNKKLLCERIDELVLDKKLSLKTSQVLKKFNQADEKNRSNKIWFCFYAPYKAGEYGINRFFRYWGGEALYNSHHEDTNIASVLRDIGIACIIHIKVPIKFLKNSNLQLRKIYAAEHGIYLDYLDCYEDYSVKSIEPKNIIGIYKYPSDIFKKLTNYSNWQNKF